MFHTALALWLRPRRAPSQVAISKTVASSGSGLSDARTASRLDRMLATLTGARRAMQVAHERAVADAAALAECRLQLQQSAKACICR